MARKRKQSPNARKNALTQGPVRLQRFLASAGFGSRRQCEELITAERVEVDGETVTKLGTSVDIEVDKVRVDGVLLKKQRLVYYAVNKPVGVVTTNRDPQGRPRVVDLVPPRDRVFPVGRLDRNSEGLILLTNDGELAQRLTHPKYGVRKVYRVSVAGRVETETLRQMRKGIYISDGFVRVEGVKLLKARARVTELEIVLSEGKNREIRRIFARLGHKVQTLRRIAVATLRLGDLPPGSHRILRSDEVNKLWASVDAAEKAFEADQAKGSTEKRTAKERTGPKRSSPKRTGAQSGSVPGSTKSRSAKPTGAKQGKKTVRGKTPSKSPVRGTGAKKAKPKSGALSFLPPGESRVGGAIIGGDAPEKKATKKPSSRKTSKNQTTRTRYSKKSVAKKKRR